MLCLKNAMRIQAKLLDTYPELKPGIMRKITVTKPPQAYVILALILIIKTLTTH